MTPTIDAQTAARDLALVHPDAIAFGGRRVPVGHKVWVGLLELTKRRGVVTQKAVAKAVWGSDWPLDQHPTAVPGLAARMNRALDRVEFPLRVEVRGGNLLLT